MADKRAKATKRRTHTNSNSERESHGGYEFCDYLEGVPWGPDQSVFEQLKTEVKSDASKPLDHVLSGLQYPELLRRAERGMSTRDGLLILDLENAHQEGISRRDTYYLQSNIAVANKLIGLGHLELSRGFSINGLTALYSSVTIIDVIINGERYVLTTESKWYGTRWYISKPLLNKIIQLMALGAGVLGVAAGLQAAGIITAPSGAVTGLIAAIIGLGAGVLAFLDFCNGIYIDVPWAPGVPPIPHPA
jgi:hypothetical protein